MVGQAKRYSQEIASGVKRPKKKVDKAVLQRARQALDTMIPRVQQVMQQHACVCSRATHTRGRKTAQRLRAEHRSHPQGQKPPSRPSSAKWPRSSWRNLIVTRYEVFDQRPSDSNLLVPAIEEHQRHYWGAHRASWPPMRGSSRRPTKLQREKSGRQTRVGPQPFHQERTTQETAKDPLVQDSAEVAHRM